MNAQARKKFFVLDTNVILHDSTCLYQFHQFDVVIPIAVIEELDRFKSGSETINFHARAFLRSLDSSSEDGIFNGGIPISPHHGKVSIKLDQKFHPDLANNFDHSKPDHKILNCAYCLWKENPDCDITLVTKDVNLRMKTKAVGLKAEDYTSDHVKDISELYQGYRFEENVSEEVLDQLRKTPHEIETSSLNLKKQPMPNEYMVLRNADHSLLASVSSDGNCVRHIQKMSASGIIPRNAEQAFALHALLDPNIKLVTISGKAGTGKTLLAMAAALESREFYRQVFLSRPVVALSNKDLGYLPGSAMDKLNPYMQPLYDNLTLIQNRDPDTADMKTKKMAKILEEEKLIIAPLAYIRGRSLNDIFFIVDESQNLTPHEVKTIITRAGDNTKMIFTGDIFQIDQPYLDIYSNGLSYLIEKMKGQPLYTHINLQKGERSDLAELASNIL